LSVPVQAVTTFGGKAAVYLQTSGGGAARPVKLGRSSDRFVEILEGLAEGGVVVLAPPKEAGGPGGVAGAKGGRSGRGSRGAGSGAPTGTPARGTPGAGKRGPAPTPAMDAAPAPAGAPTGA